MKMIIVNTREEMMSKKLNSDLKPKEFERAPPKTGPIAMLKLRTIIIVVVSNDVIIP
jgi:hypothetical protein